MLDQGNSEDSISVASAIERFILDANRPVLVENSIELFDLAQAKWKTSTEFGKLMLEAWNQSRSVVRRVEGIAFRDKGRLGLFVRKPHARATDLMEIRESATSGQATRKVRDRADFRRELLAMLGREWPGWKFESVSNRSDREHSFSAWYTRGLARKGKEGWAFIGLSASEPNAAADSILAYALLWLDWLRHRSQGPIISGLKLFIPPHGLDLNIYRAKCLNSRAVRMDIFRWEAGDSSPESPIFDPHGLWTVRVAPRSHGLRQIERQRPFLRNLLGDLVDHVCIVPDSTGKSISLRFAGLELVRVEGDIAPRVLFGLEGNVRQLDRTGPDAMRNFVSAAIEQRRADNPDRADDLYRLQAERWLESVVLKDVTKLDPALHPGFVYSQVPAFSDVNRGVIDVLGIRADRRLAVIELKLEEEINLPFQALDYWIAVKELAARKQFQLAGYFEDFAPADSSPVLYLVAPAFRFHSSIDVLLRYFDPSIEVQLVGINAGWRKQLKVLFRRSPRGLQSTDMKARKLL